MTQALPKWISLAKAVEITGRPNAAAFSDWCRCWNERPENQDCQIERIPGYVEQHSLFGAIRVMKQRFNTMERLKRGDSKLHIIDVQRMRRSA